MQIELRRYDEGAAVTRGELWVDGLRLGETRETGTTATNGARRLPPGRYRCRCVSTLFSPMTVQVVRPAGHRRVVVGWDWQRQVRAGVILVGQGSAHTEAQLRVLERQEETFRRLTAGVYRAFALGEDICLDIWDIGSSAPTS